MYITINSEFKPFTYDELTKPLRDYTEAYNKVEEQYATLAQQTEAWKNIATQENSPEAYAMYKKYSDELNAVVEDFSRGMTIQNRGKLSGLKSRYASEITPIANAYNALSNANAFRDEMRAKDDSIVFNVDRYTSLDDFLNGQMVDNSFISGRTLQADIANQVLTNGYNKYNELVEAGHSKQAAAKIIAKGDWVDETSMLSGIYDNAGITTEEAAAKIRNYTDNGIAQGMTALSSNIENMLLQEQAAKAARYRGGGGGGGSRNPRQPSFNVDDTLLNLYDAFGLAQTRQDTFKETVTETVYGVPYVTEKDVTKDVALTKGEKLNNARQNRDVVFGSTLVERGLPESTVISLYYDYEDLHDNGYGDLMSDFEDYHGYYNAWQVAKGTSPSMTFIEFLDEVKNENSDQNE
jgi:hypothetical protein